jgi:hypothetical protein
VWWENLGSSLSNTIKTKQLIIHSVVGSRVRSFLVHLGSIIQNGGFNYLLDTLE